MSTRNRWLLGAVLLFATSMRATYLIEITHAPDFDQPQFESQYHDYWARALVSGDWTPPTGVTDPDIPHRVFFRPPGYPYFLASIYRIGTTGFVWPRLIQMFLGLAACLLVYVLTRRWFGSVAALAAAALQGGYWVFIFFEGEFMAPALLIFLILIALYSVAGWADRMTLSGAAVAGIASGFSTLVRPNMLIMIPVFLLWAAWVEKRRDNGTDWRRFTIGTTVYLVTAAVAILPATLRNQDVANDRVLITSNAGINLFIGLHPDSDGFTPGVPELADLTGLDGWDSFDYPLIADSVARYEDRDMKDSEVSRWFSLRAVKQAAARPGDVVRSVGRKFLLFWGPAEVSNTKIIEYERRASPTLQSSLDFATILALGLLGVGVCITGMRKPITEDADEFTRPPSSVVVLLLAFVAVYAASYAPFFVASRFRVPVIPVLIVFGGCAIQYIWTKASNRQWRPLLVVALVFAALRVAVGVEWVAYEPDGALWHWRRGLLYEAGGLADRAFEEFQSAITERPEFADGHLSLAEWYATSGDLQRAIHHYEEHLHLDPRSVSGGNGLAIALAQSGDLGSAIDQWQRTLDHNPSDPATLNNLATTLMIHPKLESRDIARAIVLAEIGVRETRGQDPDLLRTLAAAYRADGREADALAILDQIEGLSN